MASGSADPNGSTARQLRPTTGTNGNASPGSNGSGAPLVNVYMTGRWYTVSEADIQPANTDGTRNGWIGDGRGWVGVTESNRGQWEEVETPASGWENYRRTAAGGQPRVRLTIPAHDGPTAQP